jgi:hypothetical protein
MPKQGQPGYWNLIVLLLVVRITAFFTVLNCRLIALLCSCTVQLILDVAGACLVRPSNGLYDGSCHYVRAVATLDLCSFNNLILTV